ncbi:MAG: endonuclease III [Candidatus Methanomethylicaceae archaeon]|nr:endonuclease III [Candidatus Verstraetearchaeota archaeon]
MEVDEVISAIEKMLKSDGKTVLRDLKERGKDPFVVLIGTILSQRTRDERTEDAVKRLFERFKGVEDLAEASPDEVAELIRGVGFYRSKSKSIVEVARIIRDKYKGIVPKDMEELLKLPSVGRKTANCVLVYGHGLNAIPVDTHVHRIANRIGIVSTRTPEETEMKLREKVPERLWIILNDLLVSFGRSICKPIGPKCEVCTIKQECNYYKKVREK